MKFKLEGDFTSKPTLYMEDEEVNYELLDILCTPGCEYETDEGGTVSIPPKCNVFFTVKESIGNLEIGKTYKASAKSKDILLVEEVAEAAVPPQFKKFQKKNPKDEKSSKDKAPVAKAG